MTQRIVYIDNLKALAIFTVVVGHVFYFTWNQYSDNVWFHLIVSYNMPLFFFISGMFAKEKISLNIVTRKAKSLLIPFVTVGGFYAFIKNGLSELYFGGAHFGYWFLPALFIMFVLFYIRCFLLMIIKKRIMISHKVNNMCDIIYMLFVWGISRILLNHIDWNICNLLCIGHLANYILFFWLGFLVAQNKTKIWSEIHMHIDKIYALCFLIFIVLFYYNYYYCSESRGIVAKIIAIIAIILLMIFVKNNQIVNLKVQSSLSYIGSHSLEIYVLQYFFLPLKYELGDYAWGGVNCLAISLIESVLTMVLCLAMIRIIDKNKYLNLIIFGK